MKKKFSHPAKKILAFIFFLTTCISYAQHFTVSLANFTSTTNTFEVDIVITIDQPSQGVRFSSLSAGLFFNAGILNGGTPCTTVSCGSYEVVPGHRSAQLLPLNPSITLFSPTVPNHLRMTQTPYQINNVPTGIDLVSGTYTLDRYRFTNTVPWTADSDVQLWLNGTLIIGGTQAVVVFYPYGTNTAQPAYTTTYPTNGGGVTLGYIQSAPMSRILNPSLGVQENELTSLQAVPNPFDGTFSLNFETISNEPVSLKVYDMIGKLIDNRTVESIAVNTERIGENYQTGIYNLTVSQGEKTQTVRVIKK